MCVCGCVGGLTDRVRGFCFSLVPSVSFPIQPVRVLTPAGRDHSSEGQGSTRSQSTPLQSKLSYVSTCTS